MNTNLFYFKELNSIGGIETFFYQLGKKYGKNYDITVMYRTGDSKQVRRLSDYVRVKKYREGETVHCKRAFLCFNVDIIEHIEAEEYYQMLHGVYTQIGVYPDRHEKITKRVSVSGAVRDAYRDYIGDDSIVCYNPFTPEKPRKALRLISATRLTREKGYNRMVTLSEALDKAGTPYIWDVYTDTHNRFDTPNISFHPPRLDIINYIAASDYFVQLSDTEGYCYSIVEALSVGTPVIVTDIPVAKEIGVKDGENAIVLPLDMHDIPLDRIEKGLKRFKYTAPEDHWDELLLPVAPDYEEQLKGEVVVRSKKVFYDLERQIRVEPKEEWRCTKARAELLEDLGLVDMVEG